MCFTDLYISVVIDDIIKLKITPNSSSVCLFFKSGPTLGTWHVDYVSDNDHSKGRTECFVLEKNGKHTIPLHTE